MAVTYYFHTDNSGQTVTVYAADASGAPTGSSVASGAANAAGVYSASLPVGDYVGTWLDGGDTHHTAGQTVKRDVDFDAAAATATEVPYDNTESELTAENVQAALDEIVARLVTAETSVADHETRIDALETP